MLKEQFDLAVAETKIATPELIEAAFEKLVNNKSPAELAERLGIANYRMINRAAASIEKKWRINSLLYSICQRRSRRDSIRTLAARVDLANSRYGWISRRAMPSTSGGLDTLGLKKLLAMLSFLSKTINALIRLVSC